MSQNPASHSILHLLLIGAAAGQVIPAFPGAEGFGGYAKGGRGGDVYHVTNLNASGAGSFRNGIETVPAAGRTIVFAVSGHIHINGLRLTGSKVTIAGQTAPGDGVGLVDGTFRISGDDVVVRHMRFRHRKSGSGGDCINLDSGSLNSVLDSISMQFSTDENFSSFGSPPENLTMQWSLNAWGLESHSCGGLWDQNHATCHHSLWAHNHTRNPKARPNGLLDWTNNVTFDWDIGFIMGDSATPAAWKANVRNSYFLCPPGNLRSKALEKANLDRNGNPNFSLYLNNCRHDNDGDGILDGTDKGYSIASGSYTTLASPVASTGAVPVTMDDPVVAFKKIVSKSGALRLDIDPAKPLRDDVDAKLIQNLVTQTANHISNESQLGVSNGGIGTLNSTAAPLDADLDGMPDHYETALGWNSAAQDHNTVLANSGGFVTGTTFMPAGTVAGYTRLEEYLHFLAIPHGTVAKNITGNPTSVQVDLRKFTSGFSSSPVFTVSNITGGAIVQSGTGNCIATFTPTLNHVGRARFDFTVTDSAGHTWTQTCALLVANAGLPRDLEWQGGLNSNAWDASSNNWLRDGLATSFSFGDRVRFDDSGSKTPALNVTGTVNPGSVDFDAAGNYTLGGTGAVTSSGPLTKRGSGTLTISTAGTNEFSFAALEAGTLVIGAGDLGTGPLNLSGGTLNIGANATTNSVLNILGPATIIGGSGGGLTGIGALSGASPLTINQTNVFDLRGDMTAYTGTVYFAGNSPIRMNGSLGNAAATFDLGNGTAGISKRSNAATISLGALIGGNNTWLSGATGSGNTTATTYAIGGAGSSTTFSGVISNGAGPTALTKSGAGTLTLGGANTHTGATTVSEGAVLVDGSLGNTAVTVANGALLGGDGSIGGPVTATAGAILSPGTVPFTGATLTLGGGLSLNGNTIYCDMSNSPAGNNDRISMGGALAMTGTQYFQFLLLQNTLAAGTYDLITGASSISASGFSLTHNLPAGTRQVFSLGPVGTTVRLTVTGDPATLTWTGATSANWDGATANNWTGAVPNTFGSNDAVVFDDSSMVNNVALPAPVNPRSTLVNNTTRAYTIAGGINGGSLTKSGTGSLTLGGTNTFGGGLTLNAGTIALANDTANAGALGTGTATLNGGVISMFNDDGSYNSFTAALVVPAGATARINADSRVDIHGSLSGSGTLNYYVPWVRTTLYSDWSAFTGTIQVLTDSSGGDLRMGTNYSFPGFPNAAVSLSDRVWAYYSGILAGGAGTTIGIGELSGTPLSVIQGGPTGGRALTYRIGGKNTSATFAGTISEQNTGTATSYIKTGTGTWTLSGSGSWNGGTGVETGTLLLAGAFSCLSATNVASGATLQLSGGSLASDSVNLDGGATIRGYGTLTADLNSAGVLETRGFASGTPGTLVVNGSMFLDSSATTRMRAGVSSDLITVSGDVALAGTLQVNLSPGSTFGRYPLIDFDGALTGTVALTGIPGGTTAHLSTSITGRLDLVINDSDEDGMPDSWEISNFGNLAQTAAGDKDGDGSGNLVEYRLNLNPSSGSSAFRASCSGHTISWPSAQGVVFTVKRSAALGSSAWQTLATVVGGAGTTASYTDPASFARAFYRVEFDP